MRACSPLFSSWRGSCFAAADVLLPLDPESCVLETPVVDGKLYSFRKQVAYFSVVSSPFFFSRLSSLSTL